jgi:hypothetical protein
MENWQLKIKDSYPPGRLVHAELGWIRSAQALNKKNWIGFDLSQRSQHILSACPASLEGLVCKWGFAILH